MVQKWKEEGGRPWDFSVLGKYIEDVKQDFKHVPDLLEAIMKAPGPVKEELQPILFEMTQIRSNIKQIKVSTFWIPASLLTSRF